MAELQRDGGSAIHIVADVGGEEDAKATKVVALLSAGLALTTLWHSRRRCSEKRPVAVADNVQQSR